MYYDERIAEEHKRAEQALAEAREAATVQTVVAAVMPDCAHFYVIPGEPGPKRIRELFGKHPGRIAEVMSPPLIGDFDYARGYVHSNFAGKFGLITLEQVEP